MRVRNGPATVTRVSRGVRTSAASIDPPLPRAWTPAGRALGPSGGRANLPLLSHRRLGGPGHRADPDHGRRPRSAASWSAARRAPPRRRWCADWPRCCPTSRSWRAAGSAAIPPTRTRPARTGRTRAGGATSRPARLVELPVGATEDRVIGALDLKQALGAGQVTYQPGLLAAAHRGILYVDEVNLLHDHLVDLLLDAAATGRSTVEREGVSVSHASRIVLIGTMNPEEGELRPQLLDRFGLTVEIAAPHDPALRAEVIRRRMAFDADPVGFSPTRTRWPRRSSAAGSSTPATGCRRPAGRPAADHDRQHLRRVRGGRAARRHRHRAGRRRPRRVAGPERGDHGRHPGRRPAGPAAPAPAQPVRRPRAGRGPARPAAR